ncbi:hypothetical protein [Microbacterium excoecariae]|uniref:hypothetical protein n=1 Tax=Microbacterium excoecariae TaxID=2715210 RepID=UPI00140A798C|nr:hypothetical protein [Microbacterium excoecariae]NHI16882.1 hypothetical protein [Microbacterium excoecariae]
MTWHTSVAYRAPAPLDLDFVTEVAESLADHSAAATIDRDMQGGSFALFVDAETPTAAAERAVSLVSGRIDGATVVGIAVQSEDAFDAELAQPIYPEVVGYAEIAKLGGVSRQRARQWAANPSFPDPVIETEQGPLREKAAVVKWLDTRNTRPGRPSATLTAS